MNFNIFLCEIDLKTLYSGPIFRTNFQLLNLKLFFKILDDVVLILDLVFKSNDLFFLL